MKWYVKDPWVSIPTITPVTAYTLETGFEITGGVDAKTLIVDEDLTISDLSGISHTQGTDTALGTIGTKNPPIDADKAIYRDSTASDVLVTSTWTQVKAFLKTYFDGVYSGTGYLHTQSGASTTWTVTHDLGTKYTAVEVINSSHQSVSPLSITFDSTTALTIVFSEAIAGYAVVTMGSGGPGTQGEIGVTGATGATGATGNTGPQGEQGIQGIQGANGSIPIVAAGGSADAITADYTVDLTLADTTLCAIVAAYANATTTPTFAPDGLTAHTIVKHGGSALVAGDIPGAGAVCILEYNLANTRWELLNPATTASAASIGNILYPVGCIYQSIVATSPATLFGFGTWVAFGTGRVLVGYDAGQGEFDMVEETGGAKTHTLSTAELASHNHTQDAHGHNYDGDIASFVTGEASSINFGDGAASNPNYTVGIKTATATNQATGSGSAHNNLQPYVVVYRWKRTA